MANTTIQLLGRGLRGESYGDTARRLGLFGILPTDTDQQVMEKINADAAASAAAAEAAAGPTYPDVATGLAATPEGQGFAVNNGDGTVTVYLNDGGVADEQRTLATTDYLNSTAGAGLIGVEGGGTVQDYLGGFIAADAFCKGDGIADDTDGLNFAAALAIASGKPLHLGKAHLISDSIHLDGPIEIIGRDGKTNIIFASKTLPIFTSTSAAVGIKNCLVDGGFIFLEQTDDFDNIDLSYNTFTGFDDTYSILLRISDGAVGGDRDIHHNSLAKCTTYYGDNVAGGTLKVRSNLQRDMFRHVVRALQQPDSSDPTTALIPDFVYYEDNRTFGIGTGPASTFAREIQADARIETFIRKNYTQDVISTGAGTSTVVYHQLGSLTYEDNTVVTVKCGSGNGNRIISDKCTMDAATASRYHWIVRNNTFNQSAVSASENPASVVHTYTRFNVTVEGNSYTGCHCPGFQQWQSEDAGITPKNISVENESYYDHKFPTCVDLIQQMKGVTVDNIKVYSISNPASLTPLGSDTRLRVVNIYISFNNGRHIEDIKVSRLKVFSGSGDIFAGFVYRNAVAATSEIKNYSFSDCDLTVGAGLIRFFGVLSGAGKFSRNTIPSGTSLFSGTLPSGSALLGNFPLGLSDYADDTAAAAGGVPVGGEYRTGSVIKRRIA